MIIVVVWVLIFHILVVCLLLYVVCDICFVLFAVAGCLLARVLLLWVCLCGLVCTDIRLVVFFACCCLLWFLMLIVAGLLLGCGVWLFWL